MSFPNRATFRLLPSLAFATSAVAWAAAHPSDSADELGRYAITTFSNLDYLADNQVHVPVVTPDGLLHFGGLSCVLEYDGERWRRIELPDGDSTYGMAADASGRLWVASGGIPSRPRALA